MVGTRPRVSGRTDDSRSSGSPRNYLDNSPPEYREAEHHASVIVACRRSRSAILSFCGSAFRPAASCPAGQRRRSGSSRRMPSALTAAPSIERKTAPGQARSASSIDRPGILNAESSGHQTGSIPTKRAVPIPDNKYCSDQGFRQGHLIETLPASKAENRMQASAGGRIPSKCASELDEQVEIKNL